tara:strand:+ start:1185 stop:1424 length:240 start_codon:yes stop_codon:yes gene_type:complete
MNRSTIIRNISKYIPTKHKTWPYQSGFYRVPYHEQYESRDNENEIKQRIKSYGKWYEESDKPIIRIERQKKIKEFLQQY